MAQIAEQIAALVGYVKQGFPGCDVWDTRDEDRSAQTVSVRTDSGLLLLTASYEFLTDFTQSEVRKLLTQWNVADALREEAGPTKRLLVTRDGWQVTSR